MDISDMKVGMKVLLSDSATAEITAVREEENAIVVRLLDVPFGPFEPGQEDVRAAADVVGFTTDEDLDRLYADPTKQG